jgi:hypothetical protein
VIARALQIPSADPSFLQPVSADAVPTLGVFWSVQKIYWPPVPFNWTVGRDDVQIYRAGTNDWVIDDRSVDYSADQASLALNSPTMDDLTGGNDKLPLYPTNSLWLEITSLDLTNGTVDLTVHGTKTGHIYELWTKTNLTQTAWTTEASLHGAESQAFTSAMVPFLGRTNLFVWARDWTGVDENTNSIPDWWEWENFAGLNQATNADFDSDGVSNLQEYLGGTDPNKIAFYLQPTNRCSATDTMFVPVVLRHGVAFRSAVLVDTDEMASALWMPFNGTAVNVSLGTTEGWHMVGIGLRGHASGSQPVWQWARFKLDRSSPLLVFTNPVPSTLLKSLIQVQGYSPERLASISFSVSNSFGTLSNLQAFVKDQYYDTNTFELTTNYFQCFDIHLANGPNLVTIRASDLAGNTTVTNLVFTINSGTVTNAPVIRVEWPMDQMLISGETFAVRGWLNDPSASISASLLDTNGAAVTVQGIADRYGAFWIEGIPLAATNFLTLTATDPWANATMTNLTVYRSSVYLSINAPDELYKRFTTVSGSVDPAYAVSVNGVPATVETNGAWSASGVPVRPGSTASFDVTATPSAPSSPLSPTDPVNANQNLNVDKPWRFYMKNHFTNSVYHVAWADGPPALNSDYRDTYVEPWADGEEQHGQHISQASGNVGNNFSCDSEITWPPRYWEEGATNGVATYNCGNPYLTPPQTLNWFQQDTYYPQFQVYTNGWWFSESRLNVQLVTRLFTGGKAVPDQHALFEAFGFGARVWEDPGSDEFRDIGPENTGAGTFGVPSPDGVAWALVPVGETVDTTPSAPNYTKAAISEGVRGRYALRIKASTSTSWGWKDITDGSMSVVVGQGVDLDFEITDYGISQYWDVSNFVWSVQGYAVAGYSYSGSNAWVNTNINYTDPELSTHVYWVDGGAKQVTLSLQLGGQTLTARATFNVIRPSVDWTAETNATITVDNNYWQPALHFGYMGSTNKGMLFRLRNAQRNGYTNILGWLWGQTVDSYGRWNRSDTTIGGIVKLSRGLDKQFPIGTVLGDSADDSDDPGEYTSDKSKLLIQDSFTNYLMFIPAFPGSIPVPIKKIVWSISGTATNDAGGWRMLSSPTGASIQINNADTLEFPIWSGNATNYTIIHTNLF